MHPWQLAWVRSRSSCGLSRTNSAFYMPSRLKESVRLLSPHAKTSLLRSILFTKRQDAIVSPGVCRDHQTCQCHHSCQDCHFSPSSQTCLRLSGLLKSINRLFTWPIRISPHEKTPCSKHISGTLPRQRLPLSICRPCHPALILH